MPEPGKDAGPDGSVEVSIDKLKGALKNLINLEIRTGVGDTELVYDKGKKKWGFKDDAKVDVIYTKVDLLQGDIISLINSRFEGEAGKEILKYHTDQVTKGHQIIKDNIAALLAMIDAWRKAKVKDDGTLDRALGLEDESAP